MDLGFNSLENIDGLKNIKINELYLIQNKIQDLNIFLGTSRMKVLYLAYNQLRNVDGLRNMNHIERLHLKGNQLDNIDGIKRTEISDRLIIQNNPALKVTVLPPSLKILYADVIELLGFDFSTLPNLQLLHTGSQDRSLYVNLNSSVVIAPL